MSYVLFQRCCVILPIGPTISTAEVGASTLRLRMFAFGRSKNFNDTPSGTEIGDRPIRELRFAEVERGRIVAGCTKDGTRNVGMSFEFLTSRKSVRKGCRKPLQAMAAED